ncbi:MAG: transketolase family protein [Gammaproteobacteria bacterium]
MSGDSSRPMPDAFSGTEGALDSRLADAGEVSGGEAIGREFALMGAADPDIVLVVPDLLGPVGAPFAQQFPKRVVELGIAEANAMSVAAGMAACGFKPYVICMAAFSAMKCAEQIRTDMAYTRMPVRILSCWSGLAMGLFGTSHHAIEEIAITRAIAGLTVVAPSDDNVARALLRATQGVDGPVFFRIGGGNEARVYMQPPAIEAGRFIRVREGGAATVIATGSGVPAAVQAADRLAAEGIDIAVLDAAYLKPLDEAAIVAAARTSGAVITVEEHTVAGGLGTAVAEVLARHGIATRLRLLGLPDADLAVATPDRLLDHYGLTAGGVARTVREVLRG